MLNISTIQRTDYRMFSQRPRGHGKLGLNHFPLGNYFPISSKDSIFITVLLLEKGRYGNSLKEFLCKLKKQTNKKTYIPPPFICRMCFADVDNNKVCHILKSLNNVGEVVQEINQERWSTATAKVNNQRSSSSCEIQ